MSVAEAFVSGSLGQAIYREDGKYRILDGIDAAPRDASPNEVQWFRHVAREVAPAHPEGVPVPIEFVRQRLDEEMQVFVGLDGLLVGMDTEISEAARVRAILRGETVLAHGGVVADRIRRRFLIPARTEEWAPSSGYEIALRNKANAVVECYRILML